MQRNLWQTIAILVGALAAASLDAQTVISADGVIESESGGFKFPDGSIQTTAAGSADPCPTLDPDDEMIWVGGVCIDKYEASIWDAPAGGNRIIGALPCSVNGQDCDDIYARSVAGVAPKTSITWFQAQAALENSGKRLPSNAEWQMAVRGTPDDLGPCNTTSQVVVPTGSSPGCVSKAGAFDMVGNVWEWVADWVPASTDCPGWDVFSDDVMCLSGAATVVPSPGGLIRGGDVFSDASAGPFAVSSFLPVDSHPGLGFRGAR